MDHLDLSDLPEGFTAAITSPDDPLVLAQLGRAVEAMLVKHHEAVTLYQEEVKDAVSCAGMKDLVIFSDDLAAEIKDLQILSDPMSDKYDDRQLTKAKENFENDKGRKLHKSVSFLNTGMALLDNVSTAIAQRAQDGALGQDAICVKDQVKTVGEAVCTTERNIVTLRMKLVWKEVLEYTVRIYTKGSERFRMIHKVGIKIGELPQL